MKPFNGLFKGHKKGCQGGKEKTIQETEGGGGGSDTPAAEASDQRNPGWAPGPGRETVGAGGVRERQ